MIFLKQLIRVIDPIDKNIIPPEFEIEFCKKDGTLVDGRVVVTSSNHKNFTLNLKFVNSGQIRTINAVQITKYNGKEVVL